MLGGQLYAAGGHDGPLVRKSVEVYDAQTNTWRLVCDMNMCRRNAGQTHAATKRYEIRRKWELSVFTFHRCVSSQGVCAINGLLYVIGGDDGSCNLSSVEFYNPAADKWSLIPTNMSNGRSYAGESERPSCLRECLSLFLSLSHSVILLPPAGVAVIDKPL